MAEGVVPEPPPHPSHHAAGDYNVSAMSWWTTFVRWCRTRPRCWDPNAAALPGPNPSACPAPVMSSKSDATFWLLWGAAAQNPNG